VFVCCNISPPPACLSFSLCCSNTFQHSAISMRRRIVLPYSKIHRRAALCDCGASRAAASRCCFGGLGMRRRPLALGLLNAQRNQTNDAR
jgi:hypothetical protein